MRVLLALIYMALVVLVAVIVYLQLDKRPVRPAKVKATHIPKRTRVFKVLIYVASGMLLVGAVFLGFVSVP